MSILKTSSGGQMSGLHFRLGGKCPFILFFIGGQMSWGASIRRNIYCRILCKSIIILVCVKYQLGLFSPYIHSVVAKDSVSRQ